MSARFVLPSHWQLPDSIKDRFGEEVGRQRLMNHDNHLLLVLHAVPDPESTERSGVLFWRNPKGEWQASERGNGLAALESHIQSYEDAIEALDAKVDKSNSAEALFQTLSHLNPIARAAAHLHQVLQNAREILKKDKKMITLRDQAYQVDRSAELLRGDATNRLDFMIARRGEEQAQQGASLAVAAHRLNLLAAIFFPITAVSSILGANLTNGLERFQSPILLWVIVLISLFIGIALKASLSRSKPSDS